MNHLQQSKWPSVNATTGLWTYTWDPVSQGQEAQVSVNVPLGPQLTTWQVYVGAELVGTTNASLVAGPFTLFGGTAMSMTGTPPAGTALCTAIMIGEQGDPDEFGALVPASPGGAQTSIIGGPLAAATSAALPAVTAPADPVAVSGPLCLGSTLYPAATAFVTVNLPPSCNALLIIGCASVTSVAVSGMGAANLPVQQLDSATWQVAVVGGAPGGTLVATVNVVTGGAQWAISLFTALPMQATPFAYTVTVANPGAGADWNYTLTTPARLMEVSANLAISAAAGNRTPLLSITALGASNSAFAFLTAAALPAGPTTTTLTSWPDAPLMTSAGVVGSSPMPALGMLPVGSVIASRTFGLLAGDQWSTITLVLSPV
jgi:hypothetical protein